MSDPFDPYFKWLGISPKDQPPNHYRLLGIDLFVDDHDVIEHAADRQMAHLRSFQAGKHAADSQRLLNEIANAKVCLLDREKKAAYDQQLKQSSASNQKLVKAKALPQSKSPTARPAPSRSMAPVEAMASVTPFEPTATPAVSVSSVTNTSDRALSRRPRRSPALMIAAAAIGIVAIVGLIVILNSGATDNDETTANANRPEPQPTQRDDGKSTSAEQHIETVKPPVEPPPVEPVEPVTAKPPKVEPEPRPPVVPPQPEPTTVEPIEPIDADPNTDPISPHDDSDADRRLAIPDDAAQRAALDLVRETFRAENDKAKTPDEKRQFARFLFQTAADTQNDPAAQYVLLRVARDIAASSGDSQFVCQSIDKLAELYHIDGFEMKAQTLIKLPPALNSQDDHKQFVLAGRTLVETAVDKDRYDLATELSALILDVARRMSADDIDLRKEVVALGKVVEKKAADYQAIEAALAVLADNPADAEANLVVGKYRCFEKGDWENGLPMLAMGNDPGLKAAAEQELAKPSTADDQTKLGDAWWELAEREDEPSKDQLLRRAAIWYERALPELSDGLVKAKIEKRLEQITSANPATELEKGTKSREVVYLDDLREVDFRVGFGTLGKHGSTGYPAEHQNAEVIFHQQKISHSLSTCPPSRSFAYVNYDLAGKYESLVTTVGVMDRLQREHKERPNSAMVFKVIGDGRLLWQSNPIAEFSQGQECSVDLSNVRKLQLRVEISGDYSHCHAAWINPRVRTTIDSKPSEPDDEQIAQVGKNVDAAPRYARSIPQGALSFGGHHYFVFLDPLEPNDAEKFCKERGGYLVRIESQEEQRFVVELLSRVQVESPQIWIGGSDQVDEGKWVFSNGSEMKYTNWNLGSPNNKGNEDFACILWKTPKNPSLRGKWDDKKPHGNSFVCEWD